MDYRMEHRLPTHAEYKQLYEAVGWGQIMNFEVAEAALDNSIAGVVACNKHDRVIAMGRLVGDGAICFCIQDIVVSPDHQNCGIGSSILCGLVEYLRDNTLAKSSIGLFSVPDAVDFYKDSPSKNAISSAYLPSKRFSCHDNRRPCYRLR